MDFQKQIYETVETIAKGIIDKTGYLYKVQAVITKVDPLGNYYKFEYQGAEHTGYSVSGEKYAVNDLVYVLFTNGDPLAKKMIISRIDAYNNTIDLGSIGDIDSKIARIELAGQNVFIQAPNGAITPSSIKIQALCYNNAEVDKWLIDGVETTSGVASDKLSITIPASLVQNKNAILVSVVGTDPQLTDTMTVAKLSDGSNGTDGTNPLFIDFNKTSIAIPTDSAGANPNLTNANIQYYVFEGMSDVTNAWEPGLTVTATGGLGFNVDKANNTVTVTSLTADAAQLTFTFVKDSVTLIKRVDVTKVRWGADGAPGTNGTNGTDGIDAKYVTVSGEQAFKYAAGASTPVPASIALRASRFGTNLTGKWSYAIPGSTTHTDISGQTADTLAVAHNASYWGVHNSLTFRYTVDGVFDEITVVKLKDGEAGAPGEPGRGISAVKNFYLASSASSGVVNTDPGFKEQMVTTTETNKYLWSYEEVIYTVGGSTKTSPIIIGTHGATGTTGATGRGISSIKEEYLAGASGSTPPTGTWATSMPTLNSSDKKYLWNKETVTYTSGAPATEVFTKVIAVYGDTGSQGIQGPTGPSGQSLYTWVKYADTATGSGMTDTPENKKYIGFAYNKVTQTESDMAVDYTWSLIEGPQGTQGPDGKTKYTWLKYADTPTTGISDSPVNKKYMGVAYNKDTDAETENYADYQWSLIQGPQGDKGETGSAGAVGQGVDSIVELYKMLDTKAQQPTPTSDTGWSTTCPTWVMGKYIHTCSKITYKNPTTVAYTVPVVSSEWEAANVVDTSLKDYIVSRGENLVTNGTGLLGNNTNFSKFTFDGAEAYSSAGSFIYTQAGVGYVATKNDELIPVSVDDRYKMNFYAKSNSQASAGVYFILECLDVDKKYIGAENTMFYQGTLTTLSQDLKAGDTKVYLTSATNWRQTGSTYNRSIIFWDYKNSSGYEYPPETYSKNTYLNLWDEGQINFTENTITLRTPWTGPTKVAGTKLSNGNSGGTYSYFTNMINTQVPTTWANYYGEIAGQCKDGTNNSKMFRPGTAYVKIGIYVNKTVADGEYKIWLSNLNFARYLTSKEDVANAQTAADNAQTAANTANAALSDLSNDNKLTANEKQIAKKEWDAIIAEKPKVDAQADTYGVSKTAYGTAYTALSTYITPLLSSLTTTSDIVGTDFRTAFSNYYSARQDLLNSVSTKAKQLADAAQSSATAAQTAANNAQTAANAAQADATTANSLLTDMASDNKLTALEKQNTKKEYDEILVEKPKLIAQAGLYSVSITAYTTAFNALDTYVSPLLTNLSTTSTIDGPTFRTKFSDYYSARQDLLNSISTATKTIVDSTQTTVQGTVKTVDIEYYLSTSKTEPIGGSWVTVAPDWTEGKYMWSRTKTTYVDSQKPATYSNPTCIAGATGATGATGPQGPTGQTGSTGKGVSTTVVDYAKSSSGTTAPTTWVGTIPTLSPGEFLWTRTTITYTDNDKTVSYSVSMSGNTGPQGSIGATGPSGTGVSSATVTYSYSTSGTVAPASPWTSTVPTVPAGQYLWTKTVTAYTNSTSSTTYSVSKMGVDGSDGKGIASVTNYYKISSLSTGVPTTDSDWTTSMVQPTASNKYLWNYEKITYTDNTFTDTTPVIIGMYSADGNGIASITEYYLATPLASGVTTATSGWTTTIQTLSSTNKYLWNYEVTSFTSGSPSTGTPKIIGVFGDKGDKGDAGVNAIIGVLSNESHTVPTDKDGNSGNFTGCNTTLSIYNGATDDSTNWTVTATPNSCAGSFNASTRTYTVTSMTADTAYVDLTATRSGYSSITKRFTITKSKQGLVGSAGVSATAYSLISSAAAVSKSSTGVYTPASITFSATSATGASAPAAYAGRFTIETTLDGTSYTVAYTSTANETSKAYTVPASIKAIRAKLYLAGGTTTLLDEQIVPIVTDGSKGDTGATGPQGAPGIQGPAGSNGTDGQSQYFHVRYSANADGSGMVESPVGAVYMGTAVTASSTAPVAPSSYKWTKILGENGQPGPQGQQGIPGQAGQNGQTPYLHIKYSDDGLTFTDPDGETPGAWIGQYTDFKETDSISFSAYSWSKIKGDAGSDAYTVLLTNEAHTFAGDISNALASSTTFDVLAYKGTAAMTVNIGTITGAPTGMTATPSGARVTVTVTTALVAKSGVLTIPITVDGKSFTKTFSFAVAYKGATGSTGSTGPQGPQGNQGIQGPTGATGAPAYTIALSDEATLWPTDKDRKPVSSASTVVTVSVYKGDIALSSGTGAVSTDTFSIGSITSANNVSVSKTSTAITFSVTAGTTISADRGEFTVPITVNGIVFNKTFTWSCSKAGQDGATGIDAELVTISTSSKVIAKNWSSTDEKTATYNPTSVTLTPVYKNATYTGWDYHNGTAWVAASTGTPAGVTITSGVLTLASASAQSLMRFRVRATGTKTATVYTDEETIQMIEASKQPYTMLFSNQQINLVDDNYTDAYTTVDIYYGTTLQTGWTISTTVETGTASTSVAINKVSILSLTTSSAKIKITATKSGYTTQTGYINALRIKEGSSLHVGSTPPANPKYGTLWQDISNPSEPMLRFYDGVDWILSSDYDEKIINVQSGVEDLISNVGNISDSLNNYLDDNLLTPTERIEVDAEWTKINRTYSDFQSLVSTIYSSATPDAEGIFTSFDYKELTAAKASLEQFLDDNIFSKPDGNVSVSGNDLRSKMDAYDFAFNAVNGRLQAQIKAGSDSIEEDLSTLSSTVVDLSDGFSVVNSKVEGLGDFQRTVEGTMSFDNGELTISTRTLVDGNWVDGNFKSKFSSQELGFYQGDSKVAYINNNALYITNAKILSSLEVGNIAITKGNKRLTFRKVG